MNNQPALVEYAFADLQICECTDRECMGRQGYAMLVMRLGPKGWDEEAQKMLFLGSLQKLSLN